MAGASLFAVISGAKVLLIIYRGVAFLQQSFIEVIFLCIDEKLFDLFLLYLPLF